MNDQNSYRILSHFETVYRPGERDLAMKLFRALGLETSEIQSYVIGFVGAPGLGNEFENTITASEVTPEHWAFEQRLDEQLQKPEIAELSANYLEALKTRPQNRPHFGLAYSTLEAWTEAVEGFERALEENPELKGRASLASKFTPGSPGAQTDYLHHAFIHTDIVGTACLPLGVIIELQHYTNRADN